MKPIKDKFAIAAALQEMGMLLELKGGQYFKARAYKTGARAVAELTQDIGKLIKENRLTFVKGIGFDKKYFDQLIEERKKVVPQFIINAIKK